MKQYIRWIKNPAERTWLIMRSSIIAEAKIGSAEDRGTRDLLNSPGKNTLLLDSAGQVKIKFWKPPIVSSACRGQSG